MHGTPHSGPLSGNEAIPGVKCHVTVRYKIHPLFQASWQKTKQKKNTQVICVELCVVLRIEEENLDEEESEGEAELTSDEES